MSTSIGSGSVTTGAGGDGDGSMRSGLDGSKTSASVYNETIVSPISTTGYESRVVVCVKVSEGPRPGLSGGIFRAAQFLATPSSTFSSPIFPSPHFSFFHPPIPKEKNSPIHSPHLTSLKPDRRSNQIVVLRGTTVLPRHRGTIFLRYQYCRLYGTF